MKSIEDAPGIQPSPSSAPDTDAAGTVPRRPRPTTARKGPVSAQPASDVDAASSSSPLESRLATAAENGGDAGPVIARLAEPGGPAHLRAIFDPVARENDAAIEEAARSLVDEGCWPSPEAIADRAGVHASTVRRRRDRLEHWRGVYVRRHGAHPHWTAPGPDAAPETRRADPADAKLRRLAAQLKYAAGLVREERRLRKKAGAEVAELQEKLRRALIDRRPDVVAIALAARTAD